MMEACVQNDYRPSCLAFFIDTLSRLQNVCARAPEHWSDNVILCIDYPHGRSLGNHFARYLPDNLNYM